MEDFTTNTGQSTEHDTSGTTYKTASRTKSGDSSSDYRNSNFCACSDPLRRPDCDYSRDNCNSACFSRIIPGFKE